ncbi:MAG: putative LPS assembly protein LptD, partial [Pseudomonadota bacterium]
MTHWSCFVAASIATLATPIAVAQTDEASEEVLLVADDVFENREDNTVTAQGNVEARYQGRVLRADRIVYNRTTEKVRATGNVVILDPDGTQRFADEVEVDSNLADGYAIGFSARLPEGGTTAANAAITREDGVSALDQVIYTACEICGPDDTPTWTIRARRAVLDRPSEMFSYRDAVVEVGGVPVFYLPYFAHPDPSSGRRSGFLPPRPGASSKVGAFYQQPYYWAISPHSDLTVSPLLMSRVNPVMEL